MKTIYLSLLFLTITFHLALSQQWTVVPSPSPDPVRNILNGVCSISINDAWSVGTAGELTSSTLIEHWNGSNWNVVSSPNFGIKYNELYAVQGSDANNVFAVGYYSDFGTPQMYIMHWDGASWTNENTPIVTGGSVANNLIIFPNDIYVAGLKVVGAPGPLNGTLILHKSGSQWNIESTPNQSQNRTNTLTDIKGLSPNSLWAVGYSRNIGELYQALILHKSGSTWTVVPVPQTLSDEYFLYNLSVIAEDNIWAVGEVNGSSGYSVLIYHYDGSVWSRVISPGGGGGIISFSSSDIWSAGSSIVHYNGSVWTTANAPVPTNGALGFMSASSPADIWTVGRDIEGSVFKTLIMHYGKDRITGIEPVTGNIPNSYNLFQNFPNPFNPETKIKFELPRSGFTTLKIFDMNGKVLSVLLNENKEAGNYSVNFNGAGLSSGVYFYKLSSGNYSSIKKMMIIK